MTEENIMAYAEVALPSLILPNIIYPVLEKMEKNDNLQEARAVLRDAFSQIDDNPNLTYELLVEILKLFNKNVNMNELILRAEEFSSDDNLLIKRSEFRELNLRAKQLKKILSRIPDEINDRKAFLETIKEIASAIKKKLDAVNAIFEVIPSQEVKQLLDLRKREFVKYSKLFSNTLKQYFRQGQPDEVFCAANCLISQTNLILKTLKRNCDL